MKKKDGEIDPLYLKLLAGAAILFVFGVSMMLSDLYYKVGTLEHKMVHLNVTCPKGHF